MEEIIDNIMQSPENTNPNVLRGQLQEMAPGGDIFVVNFIYNEQTYKYACDRSYDEVLSAINSGKTVLAFDVFSDELKVPLQVTLHVYPSPQVIFYTFDRIYDTYQGATIIKEIQYNAYMLDSTNQNDVLNTNLAIWRWNPTGD